jgi:hypothetical protein
MRPFLTAERDCRAVASVSVYKMICKSFSVQKNSKSDNVCVLNISFTHSSTSQNLVFKKTASLLIKKHQTGKKSSFQFRMHTKYYNLRKFLNILRVFKLPKFLGKAKEQYFTIMFLFCSVNCTDLRGMLVLVRRTIENTDAFKQELRIRCAL